MELEPVTSTESLDVTQTPPPASAAEDQKATPAATDANAEPEAETTEQQEARKQSKFQRRLERHKTRAIQAETEARLLREQLAEARSAKAPQSQGEQEPQQEDFEDYTAYTRALARWEAKQVANETLKSEREAQQGKEKQSQAAAGQLKIAEAWTKREQEFEAVTKDYKEVVDSFSGEEFQTLSREAKMAVIESEFGPALLYELAHNLDEVERIADLSPTRQAAEIGKIEAKLSAQPKRTTNAPAPPNPVTGGKTSSKDPSKMSHEEYRAYRKSQGARWAQ